MQSLEAFKLITFAHKVSKNYNIPLSNLVKFFKNYEEKITEQLTINLNNKKILCDVLKNNFYHMKLFYDLFDDWKKCNETCNLLKTRKLNIPEGISERLFCFHTGCIIIKKVYKIKISMSFDCYNLKTNKTVQLKSSSVYNDLSSFGPMSEWDELYFMYLDVNKNSYQIWNIDTTILNTTKINKNTSFEECKNTGKRPRLSIRKCFIEKYNLKPIYEGIL